MQRMNGRRLLLRFGAILCLALLLSVFACQPAPTSNANANTPPANTRTGSLNANSESAPNGVTINAREPAKYSAMLQLSLETAGGDKTIGIPSLSVQVARSGDDRRVEFKLPDGTPLVYLDHNNHHYVIVPGRKQFAELTQEATGAQMQKLMTPGQLVEDLKDLKGVERAGEEPMNGRVAEKYRYNASTNTNTKAGDVKAEAFVYVDKETGLPLRAELNAASSGDVKGMKAARVVAEMRDIKTDIEASLFEVPAGYAQVAPEKVREQIDALTSAVAEVLKALMANASNPAASPAASISPKSN